MTLRDAESFSIMQQHLLEVIKGYGYRIIYPPLVEYASSLNISAGEDVLATLAKFNSYQDRQEFALRADFTPQAARIDARSMDSETCNRVCYAGEVFTLTNPSGQNNKSTFQIGAELFGDSSIASDREVISIALDCCRHLGLEEPILFLSHATFAKHAVQLLGLDETAERKYLSLLASKSQDLIKTFLAEQKLAKDKSVSAVKSLLEKLPRLYGDEKTLQQASKLIAGLTNKKAAKELGGMLADLQKLAGGFGSQAKVYVDLGEMPGNGYSYHNGIVFGIYFQDKHDCFASGGRYDFIGKHYGAGRAATGFSIDARKLFYHLSSIADTDAGINNDLIFAPCSPTNKGDKALEATVAQLRQEGERVVVALKNSETAQNLNCKRELVKGKGTGANKWSVVSVKRKKSQKKSQGKSQKKH